MFSLESLHRGDSNEKTKYTIFNIKKKITLNLQLRHFFQRTQERVRNSRGKRAISVRAIEVLLFLKRRCPLTNSTYTYNNGRISTKLLKNQGQMRIPPAFFLFDDISAVL